MRNFAVIGQPIDHSLSPVLHSELYRLGGESADYSALDVGPAELAAVAARLRSGELSGINITLPHKSRFIPLLDTQDATVQATGSVNCVAAESGRLDGYNTDVPAVRYSLHQHGIRSSGGAALVLGAGGAARAVLAALIHEGFEKVCIAARRGSVAGALVQELGFSESSTELTSCPLDADMDTAEFQLVVNATSVGMWPEITVAALRASQLQPGQTVFDLVYNPEKTALLQLAGKQGCQTISGLDMFIWQALISARHWQVKGILDQAGPLPPTNFSSLRSLLVNTLQAAAGSTSVAGAGVPA